MPNKNPFELQESAFSSAPVDSTIAKDNKSFNLNEDNFQNYLQSQVIQKQLDKDQTIIDAPYFQKPTLSFGDEGLNFGVSWEEAQKEDPHEISRRIKRDVETFKSPSGPVMRGITKGVLNFAGLTLGIDYGTSDEFGGKGGLSTKRLQELQERGFLTLEEVTDYKKNLQTQPFLEDLTSAVATSIGIALTIPKSAISFTGTGVKFFTKEGLKKYGKEILIQGAQSFKLLGPGATVRAAIQTNKEVEETVKSTGKLNYNEWLGITLKNTLGEWAQAFAEGASEGLLRELKFTDVSLKGLLKFTKADWTSLAKNVGKKTFGGFFIESSTEQTTDLLQDALDGTKSSLLIAGLSGTGAEKKQAIMQYLIEGVSGALLGVAMGHADIFRQDFSSKLEEAVKSGAITEAEANQIANEVTRPEFQKKIVEEIRTAKAKRVVPDELKETQAGLDKMQKFGVKLEQDYKPLEVNDEEHQVALDKVKENLPRSIERIDNIMTKMVVDEHTMPNILDAITLLGRENFTNYLASLEEQDFDFNFVQEFVQSHPAYQLSNRTMNNITNAEMIKIMNRVTKVDPNILNNLAASQAGLQDQRTSLLEQDLVAGIALNFDSMGWSLLERKWKGIVTEEQLKPILDRAKSIDNTKLKPIGERALSDALQQFSGDIQAEINERAAIEAEETVTEANESKRIIDEAISDPTANTITEGGLNQLGFEEPAKTTIPTVSESIMLSKPEGDFVYGTQLYDFKGSTFKDLWSFLKAKEITDNDYLHFLAEKMLPNIKDIPVILVNTLPDTIAGQFVNGQILINSTFRAMSMLTLLKTVDHEGFHAYTSEWMEKDADGIAFTKNVLMPAVNTIQEIFHNPKQAVRLGLYMGTEGATAEQKVQEIEDWRQVAHKQISDKETNISYISNPKELITNIMVNTTQMMGFLTKVSAISTPQEGGTAAPNMWQRIWNGLGKMVQKLLGSTENTNKTKGNLVDKIKADFLTYEKSIQAFHKKKQYTPKAIRDLRAASLEVVTTGLTEAGEQSNNEDINNPKNFEDKNDEDNLEYQYITNFVELAGAIDGTDASAFRNRIKSLPTINHLTSLINELNEQSDNQLDERIKEIYEMGDFNDKLNPMEEKLTLELFKERFLTSLFDFITSSEIAAFVTFKTEHQGKTSNFNIVEQPFLFQMGDGTTKSSYVRPIVLKDFIPELTKIFGLTENDIQLVYTAGFETWRNGKFQSRKSMGSVKPYNIGLDKKNEQTMTQDLANKIFLASLSKDKVYIYLGNFGGNNTLPLLAIPKAKVVVLTKDGYKEGQVLTKAKQLLRSLGDFSQYGDGGQLTAAFRLALDDSWHGTPVTEKGFSQESYVKNNDLNATWKRGKKFIAEHRKITNDAETVKRIIGNRVFSGVKMSGGEFIDIEFRAATFDSTDDGIVDIDGEQVPIQKLLINAYNTETTDGIIYYIFEEIDYLLNNLNGAIKDGVLKSVMSLPGFYGKYSMQGVHRNSFWGQQIKKNNLAFLISDTSRKIPKPTAENVVRLSDGAIDGSKVININIKDISRISESLYTDTRGAATKQMFNGSGLTRANSMLKKTSKYDKYFQAITNMTNNSVRIALEEVNEMATPSGLYKMLKNIVNNPQSPRERQISRNLQRLMTMEEADFMRTYGGIVNHPTIAKMLRERLFRPVDSALQGRVAGMRAVLRPNTGKADKPACVDPVTNVRNSELLLMNLPSNHPALQAAFPEIGLASYVKMFLELQRQESRMINKGAQKKQGYHIIKDGEAIEVNQRSYIRWAKDNIQKQIIEKSLHTQDEVRAKALASGNIFDLINKQDKKVKKWLEDVQVGKSNIFNDDGMLTEEFVILSKDEGDALGLKPGDRALVIVTPLDSPLGIIAVRVAGTANSYGKNRVVDRSTIIMNSELIQSIVGKDFDVDSVSIMAYDPDYWNGDDFDTVWETMYELQKQYKTWLAKSASDVLGKKIGVKEVFNKEIYSVFLEKFLVDKIGSEDTGRLAGVEKFNPADHFFAIDRNYLVSPTPPIVKRQFHTILSAIDFQSDLIKVNGDPEDWLTAHQIGLGDTNFSVDFPNKTNRLKYNPPTSAKYKERTAKYEWGGDFTAEQVDDITQFHRWLFGDALTLAGGQDASTGESLDYHTQRTLIQSQQGKLTLLASGDGSTLLKAYLAQLKNTKHSGDVESYFGVKGLKPAKIMDYPLFQMIMSINPDLLPMPGSSYQDWMSDQYQATKEMILTSTHLSKIMDDMNNDPQKIEALQLNDYTTETRYAILLDNLLLELDFDKFRKNQPNSLDAIRNEIITAIQAYDEIREPEASKKKYAAHEQFKRNQKARAAMYPLLFKELLKMKRVQWRNAMELILDHNGSKYHISRTRDGRLALKKASDDKWYKAEAVLEVNEEDENADKGAKDLKKAFIKPGGVWEDVNNRLLLNHIGLAHNLSVDARINFLKPYISERFYTKGSFNVVESQAMWLSFIAQVAKDGQEDNRAQGLILAKYAFEPTKPMDFQGNDVAFELFAHFEPSTYAQWISAYSFLNQETNRQTKEMGIRRLAEDQNGAGEVLNSIRFDETDGPGSVRLAFRMLADEIKSYQSDMSDREFKKFTMEKGYAGGLKIIKGMIQNEAILEGLAASDIFFGELLHDIKNLSASAFEKKYDEGQIETINAVASMRLQGQEYEKNFLTEQFGTEKYESMENIPHLLQIYSVLKAAQKTKAKVDKVLGPTMRKMGINYLSYKFIGPWKENKIYATEKKSTLVDRKFTKDGVMDMSLGDVDIHMRPYSTRTYQTHGESSVVIAKNQEMNTALNLIQAELSSLIKSADEATNLIISANARKDYLKTRPALTDTAEAAWIRKHLVEMRNLPKEELWEARRRVFETAEDMAKNLKIVVTSNNLGKVTGYRDLVSGVAIYNSPGYNAKYDFLDQLLKNYPAQRKLEVFAALSLRELYDVQIPYVLEKALGYLESAREYVSIYGNYDDLLQIQALIDRYTQYLEATKSRKYNYMPHMYPIELFKTWWQTQYKAQVEQGLAAEIKRAQILLRQGDSRADPQLASINLDTPEGKKIFKAKVEAYLTHQWNEFTVGNPTSYIIPNFLVRRVKEDEDLQYLKGTTDMNYNYVNNLIKGLRNDMMFGDWLVYSSKARRMGERSYLIEATKMWFADQIQHKMLHTKPMEIGKLERGMQINFTINSFTMDRDEFYPRRAGVQMWGIVDKVDQKEGKLYLKMNQDKVKFEAEQDILKTNSILRNMSVNDQLAPATQKQVMMIRNQLQKGYIQPNDLAKPLEELTVHQASQLIIKGNQWVLDNLDKIGVFDINKIYTRNLRGQVDKKNVNRYMRRGAVERLDGWAREVRNLRGNDGTFDSSLDNLHYHMLKGSAVVATKALNGIKNTQAMAFLGAVVAPKSTIYNIMGAATSNILDAPMHNIGLMFDSAATWSTIKHTHPSKMTPEQRDWYTLMKALGLTGKFWKGSPDLVAIALQAGNIDTIDVLAQQGGWDAIRYLAKGIMEGAPYQAYLKRMDELRIELIKSDFDDDTYMKILEEEKLWRAKVNGLVNKKLKDLTQDERDEAIRAQQKLEKSGKKEKRSFAQEVNLTQIQALKLAQQLLQRSILRGWIGLGAQARAEVARRPGYYIGYMTALELGFSPEESTHLGINSIESRHAFYSPPYKQYGANTKAGALMQQFSQYSWNQFVIQFRMWREAVPQTMEHWTKARMSGRNQFQAFWDTVLKRTTPMLDAYGKQVINRQGKEVGELNIAHYLMMRYALGFMLMQAGTRAFYGITNWQDPMVQLFYKLGDLITDIPKGDFDPEELGSLVWFLSDTLFFLGVPYKLAMQFFMRDPNQEAREVVQRGRVEDQIDFVYRVNNQIAVLRNPYLRLHKDYKRNLEQVDYWFDDVLAGVKFFGYSAPDKSGQPYMRWGFYPGLSDEWPFIEIEKGKRMITPPNTLRYYDTNKQGIGGKGKELQRFWEQGFSPLTWIPYSDKLFYPNKKDRR